MDRITFISALHSHIMATETEFNEPIKSCQVSLAYETYEIIKELTKNQIPQDIGKTVQAILWYALLEYLEFGLDVDIKINEGEKIRQYQIPMPVSMYNQLKKKTKGGNTQETLQIAFSEYIQLKLKELQKLKDEEVDIK
ncbi:MAG: hypothetical protein PHP06_05960 [Clostridia bacterium]|nr:hypothetical protein [Clostridia bacterium]